jgi:hypothetical protein
MQAFVNAGGDVRGRGSRLPAYWPCSYGSYQIFLLGPFTIFGENRRIPREGRGCKVIPANLVLVLSSSL